MIKNITLLLTPGERAFYMNFLMPPLALGVINGYLRESALDVEPYDLNVCLKKKSLHQDRGAWLFLYDKDAVIDYLRTGTNDRFDKRFSQLLEDIDFERTDLVGISIGSNFSFFEIHSGFAIARYIQKKFHKPIVFGGDNIQYLFQFRDMYKELWEQVLQNFQYIFVGPGERSLVSLIRVLNNQITDRSYKDLSGAIYLTDKGLTANSQDEPTLCKPDFSGLEVSAYTLCLFKDHPRAQELNETFFFKWPFGNALLASERNRAKLAEPEKEETLFIPYIFNYNCPFKCAFCTQSDIKKKRVIAKDAEAVVNDLESLINRYNTRYFYFFDNAFNYNNSFAVDFCRIVKERGLRFYWCDCARFSGLTRDLLVKMREAGCRKLLFGFESGSSKILKSIDKRIDLYQARQVLRWCKECGIWAELEVILGLPYEFEEDFRDTYDFIKENLPFINSFTINKYFVVPESLMGRYPRRYGMKLIKLNNKYEKRLEKSARLFLDAVDSQDNKITVANFQVYHYKEVNGRDFKQIIKETQDKVMRLNQLYIQLETFKETQIYRMVHRKKN